MRLIMKKVVFFLFLSGLMACGIVEDENIPQEEVVPSQFSLSSLNHFKNLNTITLNNLISPNYVSHMDSANNYSVGFMSAVKDLHDRELSKVKVRVRYYFPGAGSASIICTVTKGDSVLNWQGVPLEQKLGAKKWAEQEVTFDFIKPFKDDEQLTIYVWSPEKSELYIEDLYVKPKS
jgi:hypothetical protein